MKAPGSILLIACYELGHQPLAVAWPAAFLERSGYAPAFLDLSVEPFDEERVARARLVVISVPMHTALRIAVEVVARVRATNPRSHVCVLGLYAALNAAFLLAHGVDSVLGGEAEELLVGLAATVERTGSGDVPAGIQPAGEATHVGRLAYPVPSRAGLPPLARYVGLDHDGRRGLVGYVQASRGCRHRCRHCPIPAVYGGRFFVVPLEVCLADVRQLVAAGATHITFGDPDFLNGPRHALAVARAVHAEFPALTFDFTAKVEHLRRHRAHLAELAELGCLFIVSAVESLSDAVLAHLHKGHTGADVIEVTRLVQDAGIALRPTWVAFTPWTTLADYREMLDFIERGDLVDHVDPVQLSIRLLVPPGSLLLEGGAMRPVLGPLRERDFYYEWVHPDARMDALHRVVSDAVAAAAEGSPDPWATFDRVRGLTDAVAGVVAARPALVATLAPGRARAPRLTEPWFC